MHSRWRIHSYQPNPLLQDPHMITYGTRTTNAPVNNIQEPKTAGHLTARHILALSLFTILLKHQAV